MQAIRRKLRSRRGASITFALLIFLVCAVVGSVVLTAATAASGRMSKLAEMDQRYYSVTSAADLLAQELSNKTVTIVRTKSYTNTVSTIYTRSVDETTGRESYIAGTPASSTTDPEYGTKINNQEVTGDSPLSASNSFLTEQVVKLMYGTQKCNTETAFAFSLKDGNTNEGNLTLTHTDTDKQSLSINGTYNLKKDGTLILKLTDTIAGRVDKDHYTLNVILKPHIREWPDSQVEKQPIEITNVGDSGYTEIEKETTTLEKHSEIYWTLSGVSTGDE